MTIHADTLLIIGWSHDEGALDFIRASDLVNEDISCVLPARLPVAIHAALSCPEAVVVLHPRTAEELGLIEEFLLKIDQQCKINSHFIIVVSPQAKRFKSGIQSHSVINTLDEQAVLRAIKRGLTMNSRDSETEEQPKGEGPQAAGADSELPPKPSLSEYFSLPEVKKASPVLSALSKDDRERIAVSLIELARMNTAQLDPVVNASAYLRNFWRTEVIVIPAADLARHGAMPGPGSGELDSAHPLYRHLNLKPQVKAEYAWVTDLQVCIVSWSIGPANPYGAFARALMYTVMRVRKAAA